jgi:hypothetical protein
MQYFYDMLAEFAKEDGEFPGMEAYRAVYVIALNHFAARNGSNYRATFRERGTTHLIVFRHVGDGTVTEKLYDTDDAFLDGVHQAVVETWIDAAGLQGALKKGETWGYESGVGI